MPRPSSLSVLLNKKGRRTYGAFYTRPDGTRFYMAWRKTKEIFRSGEPDISTAIRNGKACWAIDEEDLINCRAQGIKFIGIIDRDSGDRYMTVLEAFYSKAAVMNYSTRGGSLQRYLPLQHFRRQVGKAKI